MCKSWKKEGYEINKQQGSAPKTQKEPYVRLKVKLSEWLDRMWIRNECVSWFGLSCLDGRRARTLMSGSDVTANKDEPAFLGEATCPVEPAPRHRAARWLTWRTSRGTAGRGQVTSQLLHQNPDPLPITSSPRACRHTGRCTHARTLALVHVCVAASAFGEKPDSYMSSPLRLKSIQVQIS